MSKAMEALLSVVEIIADNPRLFLVVSSFLTILIGWAFGAAWIIAVGFLLLFYGIATKESCGEPARSPIH